MDEPRYSNRQIERMLDTQSADLKEYISKATEPILEQTTKHNHRMTKIERYILILAVAVACLYISNPELIKVALAAL